MKNHNKKKQESATPALGTDKPRITFELPVDAETGVYMKVAQFICTAKQCKQWNNSCSSCIKGQIDKRAIALYKNLCKQYALRKKAAKSGIIVPDTRRNIVKGRAGP